MLSKETK